MANTYVVPVDFSKTSDAALDGSVLRLSLPPYLPVAVITTAVVSGLMLTKGRYFHTEYYPIFKFLHNI
jgi:hypothetical protein